jgi:hypothetical protein
MILILEIHGKVMNFIRMYPYLILYPFDFKYKKIIIKKNIINYKFLIKDNNYKINLI